MARVMSLTMLVFITVPIFAPAIGSLILLVGNWHAIFATMLGLSIALGIWFVLRMPETLHEAFRMPFSVADIVGGFRTTVTTRPTIGYGTAFGCLFACMMAYVGSAQQILATDVYGLGDMFPLAFGSVALLMGVAAIVNSRLVRRYGMHRISHASVLAFLAVAALLCLAALLYAGHPPLVLFMVLLGLGQFFASLAMPNFNALAMEPLGRIAGTASSFIGSYTTLLGAALGGFVGQFFDGTVLPLAIGYPVLGGAAVAAVLVTERGRLFHPTHADLPR